ncbi:MAG: hypothetical protein LBQ54_15260 [Planctomycetaceae bacterium]|nr:hypothetical protein [Planctomycetaceae bacterium]
MELPLRKPRTRSRCSLESIGGTTYSTEAEWNAVTMRQLRCNGTLPRSRCSLESIGGKTFPPESEGIKAENSEIRIRISKMEITLLIETIFI